MVSEVAVGELECAGAHAVGDEEDDVAGAAGWLTGCAIGLGVGVGREQCGAGGAGGGEEASAVDGVGVG